MHMRNFATAPLPHDLVRLSPGHGAAIAADAPSWVRASLARAPWAVVRNCHAADGKLPVGIRGSTRDQRWAASAERSAIVAILPPESIRHEASWAVFPDLAAVRALRAITASLDRDWTRWGPTGGVGFSLATGWVTVTQASDLDLLLRCPVRPARASHHTPRHGSWLNIAEIELSALTRQCLDRRIDAPAPLNAELAAWQQQTNSDQRQVQWHFTTDDARVKLRHLYPTLRQE